MSKYKYCLFDLDGTISESANGIRASFEYAIKSMKKPMINLDDYTIYVGPPLLDTFLNYCKYTKEESEQAISYYRDYYNTKGKLLNTLYDGIKEVVINLKSNGIKVAVCTSKYEKFAEEIADILGITELFDAICGSTLDNSRKDKKDIIPYAVKMLGTDIKKDSDKVVMIGDTFFDAKGARLSKVDFIGVLYGYGDKQRMIDEGASVFAKTPYDIEKLILG